MIKQWLILILFGALVSVGLFAFFQVKANQGLNKKVYEQSVQIKGKDAKIVGLEDAAKAASNSEVKVGEIQERLVKEIVIVNSKPQTSTCGPAVDAAIDSLREQDNRN